MLVDNTKNKINYDNHTTLSENINMENKINYDNQTSMTLPEDNNTKTKINNDTTTAENTKSEDNQLRNDEDDYVSKSMGSFGKWQAITCIVMTSSRLMAMWNILSILFLTSPTQFICKKTRENVTFTAVSHTCHNNCIEYEFHDKVFETNLVSDFVLICDRAWMASFTQFVLMFGLTLGISLFGWISDRFGRSKAIILSGIMDVIFMVSAPFSTNYWTFTTLRFFVGVASGGMMAITAVYTSESFGPRYRELATNLSILPDGVAQATLSAFAYFSPNWRVYLWGISAVSGLLLVALLFVPESPRWLVASGQEDKAIKLMTRAAKFNNRPTAHIKDNIKKSLQELNLKQNETQALNYLDLFKTRRLSITTTSSVTVWFVVGLCYYGLNQYVTVLGSNTFIVVGVTGVAQMPILLAASVTTKIYGRRRSAIASFFIIGTTMAIILLVPKGSWISTALAVIGVLGSNYSFCILYLYVTELYPTPMRNMGLSLSSSGSKIGAMIAPFVAAISIQEVAIVIFAVLPFIAVGICFLLPETKGQKLRDTVQE